MIDEAKKRDLRALEDLAQEVERDRERAPRFILFALSNKVVAKKSNSRARVVVARRRL
jgi:hypothetical protein